MDNTTILLLDEYLEKAGRIDRLYELEALNMEYAPLITMGEDSADLKLVNDLFDVVSQLVRYKEKAQKKAEGNVILTDSEVDENRKVMMLLDGNMFSYHFQPIVRADDGSIYGYEALMRSGVIQGISPFHILKYAEMADRINEVEMYTFLNVLGLTAKYADILGDKKIFINSMPKVRLPDDKRAEIDNLLKKYHKRIVVEMTENSQYDDAELTEIKEKFGGMGIPVAIDDFGTGYSNITNLLWYTPKFVKIDRSLLCGIENDRNKRHFVRETVDFCRENGILALAEGVETSEELRTVILLGVDLIQGYYTARPSAALINAIPYELRSEIKLHQRERQEGKRTKIYNADKDERISLERLSGDGYTAVRIGRGYQDGSVTLVGKAGLDTDIHIITVEDHCGTVVLDNVSLSNVVGRPCIDVGENNHLTLVLNGRNKLDNSGIRVPSSASLTMAGTGSLDITLGNSDYYGIGNDMKSEHGKLNFKQDGTVTITANSHTGVCIGSGLGGSINIGRGRYVLNAAGSMNVCIGTIFGSTQIELMGCDFEGKASGAFSTVIGSVEGDADIHMIYSSVKCGSDGQYAAGVGSISGKYVHIHGESMSFNAEMSADSLTIFGVKRGHSEIKLEKSSLKIKGDGNKALAFGGSSQGSVLDLADIDLQIELAAAMSECYDIPKDNIRKKGGKYRVYINGNKDDAL